ncbi:amidohydrolase [Cytobacillus kochii]|uniref:amidohydrolase n=1 Tax=Cytobacillus kochii TaxID=859143 RepID=UPI00203FB736|nr:amidohydrolase [Cytobacillus kochii]MCM3323079.1 amidohydrolase [Cytobacillus kochii]MCM3345474.1 amidohydrolase [Cytobacillus kochii]
MGTLWFGGKVYTMQAVNDYVEAVFTRKGRIIATGNEAELRQLYQHELTKLVDLKGRVMLPGFVDSHMHLIGHGEKLIRLDLSQFTSKEASLQAIKEYSEDANPGEWIIGEGWNENLWDEAEPIVASDIDRWVNDHPVMLKRVCRHAISVNTMAMALAGISKKTVCPSGGVIEKDEDGQPNGLLKDQAQELITTVIPSVTDAYMMKAMNAAIRDAHRLGLTGGHTEDLNYYGGFEQTYQTFKKVIKESNLPFRAHLLVHHEVVDEQQAKVVSPHPFIEFGAMKIFADGALGGRTALLSHPYADDKETSGVAIFTQEELNNLVEKARSYSMPVAIHAIGDQAFEMALTAIEAHPQHTKDRDRIIHAQILTEELIERAKKQPLVLDIQPSFVSSDFPWVIERVGEAYMKWCYAWRTLMQEGVICAGGSDAPIEPLSPLLGIHAAVTRTNVNDPNETVYDINQTLSPFEAVWLYTRGSAYACSHEHERGMIVEGFVADFTILKEDIFNIPVQEIPNVSIEMTVVAEEIVYTKS